MTYLFIFCVTSIPGELVELKPDSESNIKTALVDKTERQKNQIY